MKTLLAVCLFVVSAVPAFGTTVDDLNARKNQAQAGVHLDATCPGISKTLPFTANGTLNASSCRDILGLAEDVYTFTVVAGETIDVDVTSNSFELFVYSYVGNFNSIDVSYPSHHYINGFSHATAHHTFATAGTYKLEVESLNTGSFSLPWTGNYTVTVTTSKPSSGGSCTSDATTACLNSNRFRVSTTYFNPIAGTNGTFKATKQDPFAVSPDVALFGFDDAKAIELVVRIVDARPFDNHFHVYYGGLTDFPFVVTVTDTLKGITKQYQFTGGTPAGGVDRATFSTQ